MDSDSRPSRGDVAEHRSRLPPWLSGRLGLDRTTRHEDPTADRALIARSLAFLFVAGAAVSAAYLMLPHGSGSDERLMAVLTVFVAAFGLLLFTGYDRLPMALFKCSATVATLAISVAVYADHRNGSIYVFFYFWAALYGFAFFSLANAVIQTFIMGVAFGTVLHLQRSIWDAEIARLLVVIGTTLTIGALVRFLTSSLRHRSLHDPLTGLPNRRYCLSRLDGALERAAENRGDSRLAVLFLDLDGFKYVNDSLGHEVGDQLLNAVGKRLAGAMRPGDIVARFGGDEFALMCENVHDEDEAQVIGARVNAALTAPFRVAGNDLHIAASVGIALSETGAETGAELLRDADAAMYGAKRRGRARCELFGERHRNRMTERLRVENDLRRGMERDEIEVHYQPIVALDDAKILGVEALARWRHPERGLVSPAEFITVAEDTGLIVPLGKRVLELSCEQIAAWDAQNDSMGAISLSVNLSARQIPQVDLLEFVDTTLAKNGIEPSRLTLEITESVLMEDGMAPEATMSVLRRMGVRLALDDFGTGYSLLSYLQRFRLDALKLDRAFVAGLGSGGRDDAITGAIVTMAGALGMTVIAEGIENVAQLATLQALGCKLGQGYLFAKPAPAEELVETLKRRRADLRVA